MVPKSEMTVRYDRSSGPGGQNVNKTNTKATVHWNVGFSPTFTEEQKDKIRTVLKNRLNKEDELYLSSDSQRSQEQNYNTAVETLQMLVADSLESQKPRKATKPSRSAKARRMDDKTQHGRKKDDRRKGKGQDGW